MAVFGWPDIIITMWSNDSNLIKDAIVNIRHKLVDKFGEQISLETSTIICLPPKEIELSKRLVFGRAHDPVLDVKPELRKSLCYAEYAAQENISHQKTMSQLQGIEDFVEQYRKLISEI